ncbi:MAG: WG repeat-containing protein [Bacteroidales bacterium]|nr:WG repeat-containing protein [Bacteroidales bacterium]
MDNRSEHIYGNLKVVQNNRYLWGVEDLDGNIIVTYGKYEWIDGFDHGLARVRTVGQTTYTKNISALCSLEDDEEIITDEDEILAKVLEDREKRPEVFAKWGIINEKGEEVLPVEYDEIWKFLGKNRDSTKVVKDGVEQEVYFYDLNHKLPFPGQKSKSTNRCNSKYSRYDMERDAWYAMTDGMYGDYSGHVDDYDFLGY